MKGLRRIPLTPKSEEEEEQEQEQEKGTTATVPVAKKERERTIYGVLIIFLFFWGGGYFALFASYQKRLLSFFYVNFGQFEHFCKFIGQNN